jgi:hypothetical protein
MEKKPPQLELLTGEEASATSIATREEATAGVPPPWLRSLAAATRVAAHPPVARLPTPRS